MGTSTIKLLNTRQVADILRVSIRTLERWRLNGNGPVFRKIGHRVHYLEEDVSAFVENAKRTSTNGVGRAA